MATIGKTVVITGGNSGIGFETAKAMAGMGWRVVITGREEQRLKAAQRALVAETGGEVDWRIGDFASLASVRRLAARLLEEPRIDVLLNNAGIALSLKRVSADGHDMMLQVNHLAPFLLTNLLLDKIIASAPARIVVVTSRAHAAAKGLGFEDLEMQHFDPVEAYARTKLYNVLFALELARRLAGSGVTVNTLHPGEIRTRIGLDGDFAGPFALLIRLGHLFMRPVSEGGKVTTFVATAPELAAVSGAYFSTRLVAETPGRLAQSEEAGRRLWELSANLVGLEPAT